MPTQLCDLCDQPTTWDQPIRQQQQYGLSSIKTSSHETRILPRCNWWSWVPATALQEADKRCPSIIITGCGNEAFFLENFSITLVALVDLFVLTDERFPLVGPSNARSIHSVHVSNMSRIYVIQWTRVELACKRPFKCWKTYIIPSKCAIHKYGKIRHIGCIWQLNQMLVVVIFQFALEGIICIKTWDAEIHGEVISGEWSPELTQCSAAKNEGIWRAAMTAVESAGNFWGDSTN